MEKRRRRPSYLVPLLFFLLELTMMWLTLSLLNWNMNILEWNVYTYLAAAVWIAFSSIKLGIVLKRQNVSYE